MADTRFNGTVRTIKRRTVNPIAEMTTTPAMQARQRLFAWVARMVDELHAVSDALLAGQFEESLSDEEANSLEQGLDRAWSSLANCRPHTLPPELASIKEFAE